jgi:hypothetical protein
MPRECCPFVASNCFLRVDVRVWAYGPLTGTGAFWENAGWVGRFLRDGLRARQFVGHPCDLPGCAESTNPSVSFAHRFSLFGEASRGRVE